MPTTTNFAWTTPVDGGSPGVWGGILNAAFAAADASLQLVKVTADAALPKAGGTLTGEVGVKTANAVVSSLGSVSGAVTLDLANADYFKVIRANAITFTFTGWPVSGLVEFVIVEIDCNGNIQGVNWPAAVKWDGGTAPTVQINGFQTYLFWSNDAGTTIFGKQIYYNSTL